MSDEKCSYFRTLLTAQWRPAAILTSDIVLGKVMLAVFAAWRAGDYARGATDEFGFIERAMPLGVWAILCWLIAMFMLIGIVARRHFLVWIGHALGLVTYGALAIGTFLQAIDGWPPRGVEIHTRLPHGAWFALSLLIIVAPLFAAWWQHRTRPDGPRPYTWVAWTGFFAGTLMMFLNFFPIDGIRGVGPPLTIAFLHGLLAIRSGPRPITHDGEAPTETVVGPAS